jgi:hypothetical protein
MFKIEFGKRSWGYMVSENQGIKTHTTAHGSKYLEFQEANTMHWVRYGVTICGVFIGVMKREKE